MKIDGETLLRSAIKTKGPFQTSIDNSPDPRRAAFENMVLIGASQLQDEKLKVERG